MKKSISMFGTSDRCSHGCGSSSDTSELCASGMVSGGYPAHHRCLSVRISQARLSKVGGGEELFALHNNTVPIATSMLTTSKRRGTIKVIGHIFLRCAGMTASRSGVEIGAEAR